MNKKQSISYLILLSATTLFLSGCADMMAPQGVSKFDCNRKEDPSSEYCRSFRAVDEGTQGGIPPSYYDRPFSLEESYKLQGIAPTKDQLKKANKAEFAIASDGTIILPSQTNSEQNAFQDGAPIRTAPVLKRTWIKTYVDENDSLHENPGLIYRESKAPEWLGYGGSGNQGATASNKARFPHVVDAGSKQISAPSASATNSTSTAEIKQPEAKVSAVDEDADSGGDLSPDNNSLPN